MLLSDEEWRRKLGVIMGNAMAERMDDDIIYGLDEKAMRYFNRLFHERVEQLRPWWMPIKIWDFIHRGYDV